MPPAVLLHAALLVSAAVPAWGETRPAGSRGTEAGVAVMGSSGGAGQPEVSPQGVCLLQHPKPVFGRQAGRPAPAADLSDEVEAANEAEGQGDEVEAEGEAESVRQKKASHLNAHRHTRNGHGKTSHSRSMLEDAESSAGTKHAAQQQKKQQKQHHQGRGHHTPATRAAREDSEPVQFLEIRTRPDSSAPLVGLLQAGEHFLVHGSRKGISGEVWLELSDGRGFVPRAHASRVDAVDRTPVGLIDVGHSAKRAHTPSGYLAEGAPPVSQDTMANNFPKKVAPKHDVDHDALDMKKTKMTVKGLPKESSYVNHLTETADWGDEYPWSTEAPSPAGAKSGAVRCLPLVGVLAGLLAWGSE